MRQMARQLLRDWAVGGLVQDVRYALRMLKKSPAVTAVAIAALALGIGCNAAVFSFVNAYLLSPLPFPEPNRLVMATSYKQRSFSGPASFPDYQYWREHSRSFQALAAAQNVNVTLTGSGEPERLSATMVSANFFAMLGVNPALGRTFLLPEESPGGNRVAVLAHTLWERHFSADPGVIGRSLMLDGVSHTILGVLPAGFRFLDAGYAACELWLPLALDARQAPRGRPAVTVFGRLKDGVSLRQARVEMDTLARQLEAAYPDTNDGWRVEVRLLRERFSTEQGPFLAVLMATVVFVLLIACANVANLMLARALARSRELAVRAALGAGRLRIVRQLLTESVLVAAAGGVLGLAMAGWTLDSLLTITPLDLLPPGGVRVDSAVLGFTLLVALGTGILFGLAPAVQAAKTGLHENLKEGGRTASAGAGRGRMRGALVVSEIALAVVLLIGAGLLMQAFLRLQRVDPGFRTERLLTMQVPLGRKYARPEQKSAFFREAVERIGGLPGVESAAAASSIPIAGSGGTAEFSIEGRTPTGTERFYASSRTVTPGYFHTLGVRLLRGREFTDQDAEGTPLVAIINQRLAKRFFPGQDPLGRHLKTGKGPGPWRTVVGVIGDVRQWVGMSAMPEIYVPHRQDPWWSMFVIVRSHGADPGALAQAVRAEIRQLDPNQPVARLRTMEAVLAEALFIDRWMAIVMAAFAGIALVLAVTGTYGVMSYAVSQRTHELGVRMALGASQRELLRLVVRQAARLTLCGVGIGLAGAVALMRLMASMLSGVRAWDAALFLGVAAALAAVALAASYLPARRAAYTDPISALRAE